MEEMKGMSSKILEMVAEELKIEPKEKLSKLVKVKESDSCLRMNHYPDKEQEIGFGEHTDPQLISVLRSNETESLQICVKDGSWVTVPPDHSSFFVNVGDTLQVLFLFPYPLFFKCEIFSFILLNWGISYGHFFLKKKKLNEISEFIRIFFFGYIT